MLLQVLAQLNPSFFRIQWHFRLLAEIKLVGLQKIRLQAFVQRQGKIFRPDFLVQAQKRQIIQKLRITLPLLGNHRITPERA